MVGLLPSPPISFHQGSDPTAEMKDPKYQSVKQEGALKAVGRLPSLGHLPMTLF